MLKKEKNLYVAKNGDTDQKRKPYQRKKEPSYEYILSLIFKEKMLLV